MAAYEAYSPIYVTACLGMTYTIAFALTTAMLVHTALWHGPRIWRVLRNRKNEAPDIHAKLMSVYKDVPEWWYAIVFVLLFALSIVCISVFDTTLPVWGFIIALLLPMIYFLPSAFIFATTAQIMTLNLVAQLVPGFLLPGRPLAVMVRLSHLLLTANEADITRSAKPSRFKSYSKGLHSCRIKSSATT